jgi:serine/threonine protein phosphatase PrpC
MLEFQSGYVVNFPSSLGCDVINIDAAAGFYLLCDGANGCRDGQKAALWLSRYLAENLKLLRAGEFSQPYLEQLIIDANTFMIGNFVDGCSTVVGLYAHREHFVCFGVGDSYAYAFRNTTGCWTLEDQLPRDLDEAGNPWQLVGSEALTTIHAKSIDSSDNIIFVLLSDGIGNFLAPHEIAQYLPALDHPVALDNIASKFARTAINRGSKDDVSALVIQARPAK